MWFAAMSPVVSHRWVFVLLLQLLEADRHVLGLLRRSPFPDRPPAAVRVLRYRYQFTTPAQRRQTGEWWTRRRVGEPVPPVQLGDDGQLVRSYL